MVIEIEVKKVEPKFLKIDQTAFKYYLGDELDKFMSGGEMTVSKRDIDRLYFQILERLENYFITPPPIEPLSEVIKKLQP